MADASAFGEEQKLQVSVQVLGRDCVTLGCTFHRVWRGCAGQDVAAFDEVQKVQVGVRQFWCLCAVWYAAGTTCTGSVG